MKIFDTHIYLGKWHWPFTHITAADTLEVMDANSIDYGAAFGSEGIAYDFIESNEWVADQIEGHKRLFGLVMVNGNYVVESLVEMDRYLLRPNFIGVKIHPSYSKIAVSHPDFKPIFDRLSKIGKPALIHTSSTSLAGCTNVLAVAEEYPDLPFIMGHMGRDDWLGAIEVATKSNNIYLDPCCSFPDRGKIEKAVELLGAEKIIFGSAMMENHPAFTIGMIMDADISEKDREMILWDNAKRVFDFNED
jgi:uncharacterized protein